MTSHKVLATIKLDGVSGRGELYYHDGDIWCHEIETGKRFATQTGATAQNALETIDLVWGRGADVWDLEWAE